MGGALLLIGTVFAMYLHFQRLVLCDALRKAEEEETEMSSDSDESVTDSNEISEDDTSSDLSGDTFDEYGFPNAQPSHGANGHFLFSGKDTPIADHSDSEDAVEY